MEKDLKSQQKTRKIKIFRTIQSNKRTISSEQGHYHLKSNRKYTLQNQQTKKNLYNKNSTIGRKNQSLPKPLTALSMYNSCKSQKPSRRQGSISQIKLSQLTNSHKNKFIQIDLSIYKNQNNKKLSEVMEEAVELYQSKKYREARKKFEEICKKVMDKYPKANYLLGICDYHQQHYNNAILSLSKIYDRGYEFNSQGYLALADAYDKTRNYICSQKILDQWLRVERNQTAYFMRARIHFYSKDFQQAIDDYVSCYELNPQKLEAYIEEAQATYYLDGLNSALEKYNELLVNYKSIWPEYEYIDINYVKYKKSLLLIQQKKYESALSLLLQVTNPEIQSQINYYIGIINSVMGNYQQGLICFSKAVQLNTSEKFVAQSYYQKFVLMFKKNDFYGIQHELDMIEGRFSENQPLNMISRLVEGIISILKMNFKSGIEILSEVSTENNYFLTHKHIQKAFKNTIISFKSFAYYSIHEFDSAIKQLELLSQRYILSSDSNLYNYTMLKGILQCFKNEYADSFKNFEKAQEIQPFNDHTLMIKSIAEILFYLSLESIEDDKKEKNEEKMMKKDEKNKKRDASVDKDKPKRKSTFKKQNNQKQPANKKDSNNSINPINLTEKFNNQEILLSAQELMNRCLLKQPENDQILCLLASIYYGLDEYETGLKFIRKAIEVSDDHMIRHYYVKANLKLRMNLVSEAISDYSNAILVMTQQESEEKQEDRQEKIMEVYLQRARCYIVEGMRSKAQSDLKTFFNDLEIVRKYEKDLCLFMYVGCSDIILDIYKNILNKQFDLYNRMKCYYLSKQLNNCLTVMNALLDFEDGDNQTVFNHNELSIDRDCLQALKKSSQGSGLMLKDSLRVFEKILLEGKYGGIFKKHDCQFFAGVLSFYSGEYTKAKNYFIDSKGEKLLQNQLNPKTEDEDSFENKTYNLDQINYNIGICDFIQGKWSPYLDDFTAFKKHHHACTENLLDDIQQMTPFPTKNRLCSIYGPESAGSCLFRLSFCLPELKLPQVEFDKNPLILQKVSFKDISMRPSAPWIQKNKKGIVFTGEIVKESIDLKSQTSRKTKNKRGQNRYRDQQF